MVWLRMFGVVVNNGVRENVCASVSRTVFVSVVLTCARCCVTGCE